MNQIDNYVQMNNHVQSHVHLVQDLPPTHKNVLTLYEMKFLKKKPTNTVLKG